MKNPNDLVNEVLDAALALHSDCLDAEGKPTHPSEEALDRLFFAVGALQQAAVIDGVWRLESVIDGDILAIARLLNQAASKPLAYVA